jgi:hypothetical protein
MERLPHLLSLLLAATICGSVLAAVGATTFHVAPDGRDTWSGKIAKPNAVHTDGPLASLQGARDAVRALKAQGPLAAPVRVVFEPGTYPLSAPVVLTPDDSGTAACPISYEAASPGKVIFEGGRAITGFERGTGNLWTAKIPDVAAGKWYFEQLWVKGRRAVRARTPNVVRQGETCVPRYLYMGRRVRYGTDPLTGQFASLASRAFIAREEDLAVLKSLPQDKLRDVTMVVYHAWESSSHRLLSVNAETGEVIATGYSPWEFQWLGPNQRYHFENFRAALDQPGEWFLDRDGTLYYWPLPGEDMTKARVVAPVVSEFVSFAGEPMTGLLVEHLALRGLSFQYAGYVLPPDGHGDGQAAVTVPAVITADGARDVALENCQVAHTGTYAIWFRRGCANCRVSGTEIFDLGAGGLRIGEAMIRPDEPDRTHHIVCDNNILRAGGRIFTGAVGVWVGQSSDNQVTHNDISDFFYTGVSVGWSWGYADTICKRNTIAFNHIHNLGWGVMSDMGGIYTLGISDGTVLANNVIHDVWSFNKFGYAGLGIYDDEGSTHITIENNLVYDIIDMTYHQHYGRENTIRNNIFVNGRNFQISVARPEPHLSITFEGNIVCWKTGRLFWAGSLDDRRVSFDRNVYWNVAGTPLDFMGLSLEQWRDLGQDRHSVVADPLFVDAEKHDFRLKPDSPALALGFKPFDYTKAGVYGDTPWVAKARALTYPPVEFAPDPPLPAPIEINDDFETYPVGAPPSDCVVNMENRGESVAVTDETSAGGKQSLKFTDAEGLQFSFNPHIVYSPYYSKGIARCSYDVRLEEGAELWQEYRDWSADPYTIGPSLQFAGGKLRFRDTVLMDLPTGKWFHVEVTLPLGDRAGKWELTVTLPGQEPRRFADLEVVTPGWKRITWIGFVSNATKKTVFYLDNLRITNQARP